MASITSFTEYLYKHSNWKSELLMLQDIVAKTELQESIKWGAPVYTIDNKNVVGFAAFKSYLGIWFFQGVFLNDAEGLLVNASEGKTKALRQWRFTTINEMNADLILTYVNEAIQNQKLGKEIKPESSKNFKVPAELEDALNSDSSLKKAFNNLSFGKQKEYANYIAEAKQAATKIKRIDKITPLISAGSGLHDKYKNC